MMTRNPHYFAQPLTRDQYLQVVSIGLAARQIPFARQAALNWLATYPGDLQAGLYYGRILVSEGRCLQALPILQGLCIADPEFTEAAALLLGVIEEHLDAGHPHPDMQLPGERLLTDEAAGSRKRLAQLGSLESDARAQYFALVGQSRAGKTLASWGGSLWHARQAVKKGDLPLAETLMQDVLEQNVAHPLVCATHLQILAENSAIPLETKYQLARDYHEKWPDNLAGMLHLARYCMKRGQTDLGVALIHQAAARDIDGQVARRLWGEGHPFRSLWPERLELKLDLLIPAVVMAMTGWNRLPAGESLQVNQPAESSSHSHAEPEIDQVALPALDDMPEAASLDKPVVQPQGRVKPELAWLFEEEEAPEQPAAPVQIPQIVSARRPKGARPTDIELQAVEAEMESLAKRLNLSGITRQDGRFPVYVIFSTRSRLRAVYGAKLAGLLESEMEALAETIRSRPGWGARVFFADDPVSTLLFGRKPARPEDPWELKLALTDLDEALASRGERIGAVLILGGSEIVPFHCLPNPMDDPDGEVLSDNPYATRDENYFIPEWPVGRLPGGAGVDARLLLDALQRYQIAHASCKRCLPWRERLAGWAAAQLEKIWLGSRRSFGYTAAIWKNAAETVFQPIGKPGWLHVSPPVGLSQERAGHAVVAQGLTNNVPKPVGRLGYFNLHGVADAPEWFGHSERLYSADELDYPVALRPQDVEKASRKGEVPKVVFSEACYGMNVQNRALDEAIALKFLQAGSLAVVGSTSMAYGSYGAMDNSLVAADLLGHSFWKFLKEGMPAGEALRQAKIHLVSEMDQRQGYLDGEDQKTLISFVLYGDPLAEPLHRERVPKSIRYLVKPLAEVRTICDRADASGTCESAPIEMMDAVRQAVAKYLPGMSDARIAYVCERERCNGGGHDCPTSQIKPQQGQRSGRPASAKESLGGAVQSDGNGAPPRKALRNLVTLSKQVTRSGEVHPFIARLTLDEQGKLVKLVVSR